MLTDETRANVTEYIRNKVAAGFERADDIAKSVADVFSDEASPPALEAFAKMEVQRVIEDHLRAEMDWPSTTDCDRLDAAFADLEANGIVARQDFSCCGN